MLIASKKNNYVVAGLGEWDKFILKKYGMGIAAIVRMNVKTYFLTYLLVNFVGIFCLFNYNSETLFIA